MTIKQEVYQTVWLVFSLLCIFALEEVPYTLDIIVGYIYLIFPALSIMYVLAILGHSGDFFCRNIKARGDLFLWELPFTVMVCAVLYHLGELHAATLTALVTVLGTAAYKRITSK